MSPEYWVIGMRQTGTTGESWARLLYYRLTGQHFRTNAGKRTQESETALGITQSIYFYIGRCEPEFGDTGMANQRPTGAVESVVPFDTGGMVRGKITTDPPLDTASRAALANQWALDEQTFIAKFGPWGSAAYTSSADYTEGAAPRTHLVAQIVTSTPPNQARAWTWEGRVLAHADPCGRIRPCLVVLSDERLDEYRAWIRSRDVLQGQDYDDHMAALKAIRLDPRGRSDALVLNEHLRGVSQW